MRLMTIQWRRLSLRLVCGLLVGSTSIANAAEGPPIPPFDPEYRTDAPPDVISDPDYQIDFLNNDNSARDSAGMELSDGAVWMPLWSLRAGAIVLRRNSGNPQPLTNGATPIDVGEMGFRYEAGPMVSVVRHGILDSCWDLEMSYFGINAFDSTASSAGATNFATTPAINFGARTVTSVYSSRLDNTEINLRRVGNGWLTFLGGFRWVELGEDFNTDLVGATHAINTNNHLYGFQVGAEALLLNRSSFSIEAFGKAGIYHNSADQSTTMVNVAGVSPPFAARASDTSFVGDLGLTGAYAFSPCWTIRGGYQVLFVDGVALASDQIGVSNIVTGVATLDTGNTAIFHGFTASIERSW